MRKRFRLRPLLFGLTFCGGMAALVAAQETPRRETRKLPDGSLVTLEGTTFGSGEHRFATGNRLQRWLGTALPIDLARRFGLNVGSSSRPDGPVPANEHLVAWFTWAAAPNGSELGWGAAVKGSSGKFGYVDFSLMPRTGRAPIPVRIHSFPRRGTQVHFGVFQAVATKAGYTNQMAAEFTLENPVPGPYPEWNSEALPASRTLDGLGVVLREAVNRRVPEMSSEDLPEFRTARLTLEIRPPAGNKDVWRPGEVVLSDATGNQLSFGCQVSHYQPNGEGIWRLERGLELPADPVWKVSTRLVRERDLPRRALFPRFARPGKGESRTLDLRAPIDGGEIVLERITPSGTQIQTTDASGNMVPMDTYELQFRMEERAESKPPIVSMREAGENAETDLFTPEEYHGRWRVRVYFKPGVRRVDLAFEREYREFPVPDKSRLVEFIVRPRLE